MVAEIDQWRGTNSIVNKHFNLPNQENSGEKQEKQEDVEVTEETDAGKSEPVYENIDLTSSPTDNGEADASESSVSSIYFFDFVYYFALSYKRICLSLSLLG